LKDGNDGKLMDIVNLAEEKLTKVFERIAREKGDWRIKGFIVHKKISHEIHVDFKDGEPYLAVSRGVEGEVRGRKAYDIIREAAPKATGIIEVYKVDREAVEEDAREIAGAKISGGDVGIEDLDLSSKLEEHSTKMKLNPILKTLILRDAKQLNDRSGEVKTIEDLHEALKKEIEDSRGIVKYILIIMMGAKNWKSIEIIAKDGRVITANIYDEREALSGAEALRKMFNLNGEEVGAEAKYMIFVYEIDEDKLKFLDMSEGELASQSIIEVEKPKMEVKRKRGALKVETSEKPKPDAVKIMDKASNYFKDTLNSLGYTLEGVNVNFSDDKMIFEVKIKRKGWTFRKVGIEAVREKLRDDASWVAREFGWRNPVEVKLELT
jgi:hypothetical protein